MENPFSDWDCEPPLATFYEHFTSYNDAPGLGELLDLIPDDVLRDNWQDIAAALFHDHCGEPEENLLDYINNYYPEDIDIPTWEKDADLIRDTFGYIRTETPHNWSGACGYFGALETLCHYAGITCHNTHTTGYCQGHTALVIAFATPKWIEKTGAPEESLKKQCEYACKLYGYWAWGDVYYFKITTPEGEDLETLGGYYGDDHEESGLLEQARETIDYHIQKAIEAEQEHERNRLKKLKELIMVK